MTFFGSTVDVSCAFWDIGEYTSCFNNVFSSYFAPWNLGWVSFCEHSDLMTIDYQHAVFGLDFALEAAMSGIILEHVDHVVQWNEWIVDGYHLDAFGQSSSEDYAPDTTESVDTN